ncbi:DEAD/DEAH box helicase [Rhodanobacter sp. AS-Z3]|uniref:DEAD/DEAH box helicase n=1 Tax=Rhodanobacter sp. AS-Z3 TaxID=3031330 RepID=UPI00247852AB|nr:DEAD/DEAH box helicase [Rhodanobacter sp. AS-Z3]WEN15723.1 DEAD/DEAH box helicase [Rhodanobacter sp. AS-Z3]
MNAYQIRVDEKSLGLLDSEENAAPLVAAARILQSTSQHVRRSEVPPDTVEADELSFQAALAFAMHGNFPSARAALSDVSEAYLASSAIVRMVAVICDPCSELARTPTKEGFEEFREPWAHSLRDPQKDARVAAFQRALKAFTKAAMAGTMEEGALLLGGRMAAHQAKRLAVANLLDVAPEIPAWFVNNSIKSGMVTLLPPQHALLSIKRIAAHGRNTLLTLPTSTGKTFVAEACISASLADEGLCVYVAPYVAVGEQVKESLKRRLDSEVKVVPMFGGFQSERLNIFADSEVVVATPERFDGWLRSGEDVGRLRTVVFDEIHILENGVRGARVEGVISRLRLLQRNNPQIRIMGLSAVLTEPQRVCDWLGVEACDLHQIGWRPTARRLAMCMANGDMYWIHGNDALRPSTVEATAVISAPVKVSLPGEIKYGLFAKVNEKSAAQNVASLAQDLLKRLASPGLVVCPRKVDTRLLARTLIEGLEYALDEDVQATANSILERYPYLDSLVNSLRHGMAYHNASLPYDVRRDIERLTRARKLSVVCATTTLAEGADLPFRWTIVSHWLISMQGSGMPMKSMTFRNIAGRCGRAGAFSEGDTVLFDNLMGPPSTTTHRSNASSMKRVMFSSSPLASTLGSDWADTPELGQKLLEATFSSQLLACIGEHPDGDDIVSEFVGASYAGKTDGAGNIRRIFDATLGDVLDNAQSGGALAVMNSPIRLTEFGQAANLSGFSPKTCRLMVQFLSLNEFKHGAPLFAELLSCFNAVPEQSNEVLRKIFSGNSHRNVLTAENLEGMLTKLLAPMDRRQVFNDLRDPKSKAQPDTVETMFEDFVSFIDSVVGNFLPWLLRGLESLSAHGSDTAAGIEWGEFARDVEKQLSAMGGPPEPDEPLVSVE